MSSETVRTEARAARGSIRLRSRNGDLGLWPVIAALLVIGVAFDIANPAFLSARNLTNLASQTATLGTLTLGIVLVLLVGEIDLSIGSVSGFTSAVMALLLLDDWPTYAAIAVAVLLGAAIGIVQGSWVVFVRAPSFIVTLTGLLVWQGFQLWVLQGESGQVRVDSAFLTSLAIRDLPKTVSWAIATAIVLGWALATLLIRQHNARVALGNDSAASAVARLIVVAVLSFGIVGVMNSYLGVPYLLAVLLGLTAICGFITSTTVFGRHLYAIGGSAEAARRAGIRVNGLKLAVFTAAATLAAVGGTLEAARSFAVDVNAGGGNTSLDAIAAAVIGGTSLFGGRGRIGGALLGALVISSIGNGLALLGGPAASITIVTGLILLGAVTLDVTSRRRRPGAPR